MNWAMWVRNGESEAGCRRKGNRIQGRVAYTIGSRVQGLGIGPQEEGNWRKRNRIHRKGKDVHRTGSERLGKGSKVEGKE